MAAGMLSKAAASAPASRLWLDQEVVNSETFGSSKEFCVRWSSGSEGAGLRRVNAVRRDVALCAGRSNTGPGKRPSRGSGTSSPKFEKFLLEDGDDETALESAMETLFEQLEIDPLQGRKREGDQEFTDEELAILSQELQDAFRDAALNGFQGSDSDDKTEEGKKPSGLVDMVKADGMYGQASGDKDDDEEEDDEQKMVHLKEWQLRKLAVAAEKSRSDVNVKSLAAELGMDRADVLSFLRDPPPELMRMSGELDDQEDGDSGSSQAEVGTAPSTATSRKQSVSPPSPSGGPQRPRDWDSNKRLRKEHVATFERVYRQSHRPSNTMVENLVNLTHVPRKKILKWFDEKRAEDQPEKPSFEDASGN